MELIARVRSALDGEIYALAAFLDIEEAFDNPIFCRIESSLTLNVQHMQCSLA